MTTSGYIVHCGNGVQSRGSYVLIVADSVCLKIDVLGRVSRLPRRLVTSAVIIVIIIIAVSRTSNKTAGDDTAIDTGEQSQEKE